MVRALGSAVILGLLLCVSPRASTSQEIDPFVPDTVFQAPGAPRMVRLPAPGAAAVALRLSIPVTESFDDAGTAYVLQLLGTRRAQALATPVGAHVDGARTPWGIVYTVVGAAADYDYLAYLLREAAAEPVESGTDVRRAVRAAREELERREETPGGRLAALLRERALPSSPPLRGSRRSLSQVTGASLRGLWRRTHAAGGMTAVVSGDIPAEVLRVSFQAIAEPAPVEAPRATGVPREEGLRTQVLRRWYGQARTVPDPRDPHAEVAARLVASHLRKLDGSFEAEVLLWEADGARAMGVIGAAYARGARAMRSTVRGVLEEVARSLSAADVERAVDDLTSRFLMDARGHEGRVRLVERHLAATGDPGAARRYLDALAGVDVASTRRFLETLAARPPVEAEIRP